MRPQTTLGRRDGSRSAVTTRIRRWAIFFLLAGFAWLVWVKFEWFRPIASLREPLLAIGQEATIRLDVTDTGSGLRSVEVFLEAEGTRFEVLSREFPATGWRGSGVFRQSFDLPVEPVQARLPQGEARLVVRARDHSWLNYLVTRPPVLEQSVEIDYTPPTVEVLTGQHYMRLGGSELVVYKPSEDAVRSGVEVESYFFPGTGGLLADPRLHVAMFAVPQDLSTDARPKVVAEDKVGNRREASFWVSVRSRRFPERSLEIDRNFLEHKVPEILANNGMPPVADLVQGYLVVNRDLRRKSEERIREACSRSAPKQLWQGVFLRQPNAAPLSSFADRRTYTHDGQVIDHQTHLGYDLASLRLSPVPAANDGRIAFAGNLGIYGDTVIIDHGLGVFSLYGHLSSLHVAEGDSVKRGDPVGRTGESGLAGGDHLHFSIMLWGIHVDPVEWWDPKWIEDHLTAKLDAFREPARVEAKGS